MAKKPDPKKKNTKHSDDKKINNARPGNASNPLGGLGDLIGLGRKKTQPKPQPKKKKS